MWYVTSPVVGVALGLWVGIYLKAILTYWESVEDSTNAFRSFVTFLIGGGTTAGGVAGIASYLGSDHAALYLLGAGCAVIYSYFYAEPPLARPTPKQLAKTVDKIIDAAGPNATSQQLLDILFVYMGGTAQLQETEHLTDQQLDERWATTVDSLPEPTLEEDKDQPESLA